MNHEEQLLNPKDWNVEPEEEAILYTMQSIEYFYMTIAEYFPDFQEQFEQFLGALSQIALLNTEFVGWKAVADEWCGFLNAAGDRKISRAVYKYIVDLLGQVVREEEAPIIYRAAFICSCMMAHLSFEEAHQIWKEHWVAERGIEHQLPSSVELITPDHLRIHEGFDGSDEISTEVYLCDSSFLDSCSEGKYAILRFLIVPLVLQCEQQQLCH